MENQWQINYEFIGVEQIIDPGFEMDGTLPSDDRLPDMSNRERQVLEIEHPLDDQDDPVDGGGLFDPGSWFRLDGKHVFLGGVHIMTDSDTVDWEVYITSGLDDGNDENLDDPDNDVEILSGTGPFYEALEMELLPTQRIRVVTGSNDGNKPLRVMLHVTLTTSEAGFRW